MPWTAEVTRTVTTTWNTSPSHIGNSYYAYDFGAAGILDVAARASRAGAVAYVNNDVPSEACGSDPNLPANYVVMNHIDGDATLYLHLQRNLDPFGNPVKIVNVGNQVPQGGFIGRIGKTGWTNCGPHLHFARQVQGGINPNNGIAASMAIYFGEYSSNPSCNPPPCPQFQAGNTAQSRNYDTAVLFAHAPVPAYTPNTNAPAYQNADPRLQLRKDAPDLTQYSISGPGPIDPSDGWNDDPSSVHVPEGVVITLYEHIYYVGRAESFFNKDSWLPDNYIGNDATSALRYDGVWLYQDINFNNSANYSLKAEFLNGEDGYLPDNFIGNDSVSSLRVGHNWRVIIYQDGSFLGQSRTFDEGEYPDLRIYPCSGCSLDNTWNDAASSIKVFRIGP